MQPGKKIVFVCLLSLLFPLMAALGAGASITADDPSQNGGDARVLGMGRAYTAISDDPNAVFLNPAGLASVKNVQATGMFYSKMYGTYSVFTGAGVLATPIGSFGIGYVGEGTGDIADTRDPSDIKNFGYTDNVFLLSYGTSLGKVFNGWQRVFVGATAKLFSRGYSQSVGDSASAFNVDLGLKYVPTQWLSLGLAKSNVIPPYMGGGLRWTSGNYEVLDSPTRLGAALKFFDGSGIVGLDAKIPSKSEEPVLFALGGEYGIDSHFSLRAGLDENIDADKATRTTFDPSLGLGFKYDFMRVDYAYRPYFSDSSNATHYISISFFDILDTLLKIKIGKVEEDDLKESLLEKYPGIVVDDLGNVIRNNKDFYFTRYPKSWHSIVQVSAYSIDYDTLLASVFTDLKMAEEERVERKYLPGDIVSIIVEAPRDTETVSAKMPNGELVGLVYDDKAEAWHGIWRVPEGVAAGAYRAEVTSVAFDGHKLMGYSSSLSIGSGVAAKPISTGTAETVVETKTVTAEEAKEVEKAMGGPEGAATVGVSVSSPLDKSITYSFAVEVEGAAGDQIKTVFVNGDGTSVGADGTFFREVPLSPGKNLIVIEGGTATGAKARVARRVLRFVLPEGSSKAEIAAIKAKPLKEQAIMTMASDALMGKTLHLNTEMRRSDAAVIFTDLKGLSPEAVASRPFKDVDADYWAAGAIEACRNAGLFRGYPDGRFMPEKKINAAEFLAVVLRSEGIFVRPAEKKEYWAAGVIEKSKELKFFKGIETRTVRDFKKPIVFGDCAEALSKTSVGQQKANDLLDWEKGF